MTDQQQGAVPPKGEHKVAREREVTSTTSGSYQTPVDSDTRKNGIAAQDNAEPTAVPESGSSDQWTEGGGNQGTEKR